MARALYASRELERRIQDALITRISAVYERSIAREIYTRMKSAAKAYEEEGNIGVDIAMEGHLKNLTKIMLPMYETTMKTFNERFNNGMKKATGIERKASTQEAFELAIRKYLTGVAQVHLMDIEMTTKNQIMQAISRGQIEGLSVFDIGKNIMSIAPSLSAARSNVIARTETHGAANYAGIESAREAEVDMLKEWISTADARTRDAHNAANGDKVPLDGRFDVGGEKLDHPGDSVNGSAGNVINCRCALGYALP